MNRTRKDEPDMTQRRFHQGRHWPGWLKHHFRSLPQGIADDRETYAASELHHISARLRDLVGPVGKAKQKLNIAFCPLSCDNTRFYIVQALLAVALEARGHDVRFVLCDQAKPNCHLLKGVPKKAWRRQCQKCYLSGLKRYQSLGMRCDRVTELVAQYSASSRTASEDHSIDASLAEASLIRQMQGAELSLDDESLAVQRQDFHETCRLFARLSEVLIRQGTDVAIVPDGLYASFGKLLDHLQQGGVRVLTHARGRRRNAEGFSWGRPVSEWNLEAIWSQIHDRPLTQEEQAEIDCYLESRIDHRDEVAKYSFGDREHSDAIRRRLEVPPGMPLDVMFPNLMWDANTVGRHHVFDSQRSWIEQTVRWYAGNPQRVLCFKAHPAEAVRGCRESAADIALASIPEGCSNVKVIRSDEAFHSHSVMAAADRGLVYTSTVGLELAVQGKAAIVAGRTHYAYKGFTIDPTSPEDYLRALATDPVKLDEADRQRAVRYFHLWAFRAQVPWPFFAEAKLGHVASVDVDALQNFGAHPTIRRLTESIEASSEAWLTRDSGTEHCTLGTEIAGSKAA